MRPLIMAVLACLSGAACVTAAGQAWVTGEEDEGRPPQHPGWSRASASNDVWSQTDKPTGKELNNSAPLFTNDASRKSPSRESEAVAITAQGTTAGPAPGFQNGDRFRNTYYDFPKEETGAKDASIFDASCKLITNVTREFHDRLCVQGSGRISTGETVSFAKRDCECASVCPRTDQKICFEKLDPARFPSGRGALGTPITPLRTVAVDTSVIPLGTVLYIPELKGVAMADGGRHNGCFIAEDRGMKVTGRQIDIFTGDPGETTRLNKLVPSNRGVRVYANDSRCRSTQ